MNKPTISVVIPTWNRAHTIEAAISSVLSQTFAVDEILVCDDGSTDDTQLRVQSFGDSRVRWIAGARGGCPAIPRNRGIAVASGDWLAFLDSDDIWLPEKLERQVQTATAYSVSAVCSNAFRFIPGDGDAGPMLPHTDRLLGWRNIIQRNHVHCSSVIVRRELFDTAEGFPETPNLRVGEDYALWMRISTMTNFAYIGEPLLVYRDDPMNSVRAQSLDGWSERIQILNDFVEWCARQKTQPDRAMRMARNGVLIAGFRKRLSKIMGRVS